MVKKIKQMMIVFNAKTLDELESQIRENKLEIARESVIATLIGLKAGVESVDLPIHCEEDTIEFSLSVMTEEYEEIFRKNWDALEELEEYELLSEIQTHIG